MSFRAVMISLLVVACSKAASTPDASVDAAPPVETNEVLAWAKRAPKSFDGQVGPNKFSIELVEGFTMGRDEDMQPASNKFVLVPKDAKLGRLTVEVFMQRDSLEHDGKDKKAAKNQKTDRGWVLSTADESAIVVQVESGEGEAKTLCKVDLLNSYQQKDVLLPWFEKMCNSLKLK